MSLISRGAAVMLTLEVRRRPGTGAEMFRIAGGTATVGASSGNEVVVRARGGYGRHVRLFERDGSYHLDLFKGIETVHVNGREFFGGTISVGDRITIGEATITVVEAGPAMRASPSGGEPTPVEITAAPPPSPTTTSSSPISGTPAPVPTLPVTEVEYRGMRLAA